MGGVQVLVLHWRGACSQWSVDLKDWILNARLEKGKMGPHPRWVTGGCGKFVELLSAGRLSFSWRQMTRTHLRVGGLPKRVSGLVALGRSQEQNEQGWPALGGGSLVAPGHGDSTPRSDPEEQGAHAHSVGWVTMLTHGLQVGETDLCGFEVVEIRSTGGTLAEEGERQREARVLGLGFWRSKYQIGGGGHCHPGPMKLEKLWVGSWRTSVTLSGT